jgi:hypothetical protein
MLVLEAIFIICKGQYDAIKAFAMTGSREKLNP